MLNFINDIGGGLDYDVIVPRLKAKFRKDGVSIGGSKFSYKDMTSMVFFDKMYTPYIFASDDARKSGLVLDFTQFYCVGMAEVLGLVADSGSPCLAILHHSLADSMSINLKNYLELAQKLCRCDIARNEYGMGVMALMRTPAKGISWPKVSQMVNLLYVLSNLDEKLFCETMFQVMLYSYTYASAFCSEKHSIVQIYEDGVCNAGNSSFISRNKSRIGSVKNELTGKRITDSRGVGICSFLKISFMLFSNYGECMSSDTIDMSENYDEFISSLSESMASCVGNDILGKYLKKGWVTQNDSRALMPTMSINIDIFDFPSKLYLMERDGSVTVDESGTLSDGFLDDMYLYISSFGDDLDISDLNNLLDINMHYTSPHDMCCEVMNMLCIADEETVMSQLHEMAEDMAKDMSAKLPDDYEDIKSELFQLKQKLSGVEKQLEQVTADSEKEIKSLMIQLEQRTNNNRKLLSLLEESKENFARCFSDTECVDDDELSEDDSVTLEEMLAYINDFKFAMVGGQKNLISRLEEAGMKNVIQISGNGDIDGKRQVVDFIVIQTKFVAHKLVCKIREQYLHQADTIFYYNGTNAEMLIKACYNYVKKWME